MNVVDLPVPSSFGSGCPHFVGRSDGREEPLIRRSDLEPCALGVVGNLSYSTRDGGTPRACHARLLLSDTWRSVADKWTELTASIDTGSAPARARRETLIEVRLNSRLIGNLLGSLTAKVDETSHTVHGKDQARIVRELMALAQSSNGDVFSLKGAKYCLETYLQELTESDLVALRYGVLSEEIYCEFILSRISARSGDSLRAQASRVLEDIAQAVKLYFAQYAIHGPLTEMVDMLAAGPVDTRKLLNYLLAIPCGSVVVRDYLDSLHKDAFKVLLDVFRAESLESIKQALSQIDDMYQTMSLGVLQSFSADLDYEFNRRSPQELRASQGALGYALMIRDEIAASSALHRMGLAVEDTIRIHGMLSEGNIRMIGCLVERCMDLFRDHLNNPDGPLNGYSLSKLDDDIRVKLGGAASSLRRYGLELEPGIY